MTRAAVVVAHPDDETLWFGGWLARHPGTTVICCSIPRKDPIRAWKFFDACAALQALPRLLPFEESEPQRDLAGLDALDLSAFDLIATHNEAGEYGHRHHAQVHRFVRDRFFGRLLVTGGAETALAPEERDAKGRALRCYDHVSPADGTVKWQALLARYRGQGLSLDRESHEYLDAALRR